MQEIPVGLPTNQMIESAHETVKPLRRRSVLRFKLSVLLLLFIPVGLVSIWGRERYLDGLPIDWQTFSAKAFHQQLHDGRTVLVFHYFNWDLTGELLRQKILETPDVRRAIRKNRVVPFLVSGSTEQVAQLREMFHSIYQQPGSSALVVCHPSSPSNPVVFHGLVSKDAVVNAIYASQ